MGNCKDCKHWAHHDYGYGKTSTECEAPDSYGEDGSEVYASAADDTDLNYGLKTGPMFGCVKFQSK